MGDDSKDRTSGSGPSRITLGVLLLAALFAAGAIGYSMFGKNAEDVSQPAASTDSTLLTLEELRERAEADPLDAGAWQELGFAYFADGQFAEAARAYRQAAEGDPDNAVLWSSLGEARVMASERDPMPANAVAAFRQALELDSSDPRARYFLAVKKDLDSNPEGAIADWLALLEDTPPGAPWEDDLRRTIEQVGKINSIDTSGRIAAVTADRPEPPELTAGNAIPGPSREQIAAASTIAPGEQRQMAEGMVERLEGRLESDPSNVDGWVMLMRSRVTLGQPERAKQALTDAIAANPRFEARLRQEAQLLGIR